MSDDLYSDDLYDDEPTQDVQQTSGPKALRDAYEREKEARKALEERLTRIEQESKRAKLAEALKGSGVNPEALGDSLNHIDPEKAADEVAAWRKAFGLETEAEPAVSEEDQQAMAAVTGEPGGAAPSTTAGDPVAALKGIDNEEDFWKFIQSQ